MRVVLDPRGSACRRVAAIVVGGLLGCGADPAGTEGSNDAGDGASGDGFELEYRAGPAVLLDLSVTANLQFTGTIPALPPLSAVGVAQAHAIVLGNGQQIIDVSLSSTEDLDVGDRFGVDLEFSRANQGAVLDGGGTLTMGCGFSWWHADDTSISLGGDCDVRRSDGGYAVTVLSVSDDETEISGTVTFAPVPNEPVAFTPGSGCPEDQTCLSLDPEEYEPETGYCMPTTRLKSQAEPCSADCSQELRIEVGGEETCICTAACGVLEQGGGGDPPTCDPAYGCIDF